MTDGPGESGRPHDWAGLPDDLAIMHLNRPIALTEGQFVAILKPYFKAGLH